MSDWDEDDWGVHEMTKAERRIYRAACGISGEDLTEVLRAHDAEVKAEVRAAAATEMREYIARDDSSTYVQGWNRALEVVADHIEREA